MDIQPILTKHLTGIIAANFFETLHVYYAFEAIENDIKKLFENLDKPLEEIIVITKEQDVYKFSSRKENHIIPENIAAIISRNSIPSWIWENAINRLTT